MSLVSTSAVVLRTYRYSETSKIVRLATRDLGVQSAIAKGVLRKHSPFGAALETLSEGVAQLYHRETRELQTLAAFDVISLRRDLACDLGRFAGAAALAEVMLKMAPPAPLPAAYDALIQGLDALVVAAPTAADAVASPRRSLSSICDTLPAIETARESITAIGNAPPPTLAVLGVTSTWTPLAPRLRTIARARESISSTLAVSIARTGISFSARAGSR